MATRGLQRAPIGTPLDWRKVRPFHRNTLQSWATVRADNRMVFSSQIIISSVSGWDNGIGWWFSGRSLASLSSARYRLRIRQFHRCGLRIRQKNWVSAGAGIFLAPAALRMIFLDADIFEPLVSNQLGKFSCSCFCSWISLEVARQVVHLRLPVSKSSSSALLANKNFQPF